MECETLGPTSLDWQCRVSKTNCAVRKFCLQTVCGQQHWGLDNNPEGTCAALFSWRLRRRRCALRCQGRVSGQQVRWPIWRNLDRSQSEDWWMWSVSCWISARSGRLERRRSVMQLGGWELGKKDMHLNWNYGLRKEARFTANFQLMFGAHACLCGLSRKRTEESSLEKCSMEI